MSPHNKTIKQLFKITIEKMESWSTICRLLKCADKSSEMSYQMSLKCMLLNVGLGWKSSDITEQPTLQLGATNRLIPDIVVSNGKECFVVEIKKANHIKSEKDIAQLTSYMKQLETPVGIYIGKTIEVYFKTIGDGSSAEQILSLTFEEDDKNGELFVNLFSSDSFSLENVKSYFKAAKEKTELENAVRNLVEQMASPEFAAHLKELIKSSYEDKGIGPSVIEQALSQIQISVTRSSSEKRSALEVPRTSISRKRTKRSGSNNVTAKRYAYGLIEKIINKNIELTYRQLYSIFNRKNYIIDITEIEDETRWCLDEDDIITLTDGTKIAVSSQWGFHNNCKPKMDKLKEIAKAYDISLDYESDDEPWR